MTELNVCRECGHVEGNEAIKIGDKFWFKGIHYIIATVDYDNISRKVGIQLIDPDNGTRCAKHPVYVENSSSIKESELVQLMTMGDD